MGSKKAEQKQQFFRVVLMSLISLFAFIFIGYQVVTAFQPYLGVFLAVILMLLLICTIMLAANLIADRKFVFLAVVLYLITILATFYSTFDRLYRLNTGTLVEKDIQTTQSLLINFKNSFANLIDAREEKIDQLKTSLSNQVLENRGWGSIADGIAKSLSATLGGTVSKQTGSPQEINQKVSILIEDLRKDRRDNSNKFKEEITASADNYKQMLENSKKTKDPSDDLATLNVALDFYNENCIKARTFVKDSTELVCKDPEIETKEINSFGFSILSGIKNWRLAVPPLFGSLIIEGILMTLIIFSFKTAVGQTKKPILPEPENSEDDEDTLYTSTN